MVELTDELNLLVIIHQNFSSDYLLNIVLHALKHRQEAGVKARKFLEKAVKIRISVPGFRSPLKAPAHIAAKNIVQDMAFSEAMLFGVLGVWAESRADLQQVLKQFCQEREIDLQEELEAKGDQDTPQNLFLNLVLSISEAFHTEHSAFSPEDVKLMLWCEILDLFDGVKPSEEEIRTEALGTSAPEGEKHVPGQLGEIWRQVVEEFKQIPAGVPEWDQVEVFIEAVRSLAHEKRAEREGETAIAGLQEALKALLEKAGDTFSFFGFTEIPTWDAGTCSPEVAPALAKQVLQLAQGLVKHRELRQRSTSTLAEEEKRRQDQEALEEDILALHKQLAGQLMPPTKAVEPSHLEVETAESLESPGRGEEPGQEAKTAEVSPVEESPAIAEESPQEAVVEELSSEEPESHLEEVAAEEKVGAEAPKVITPSEFAPTPMVLASPQEAALNLLKDDREANWQAFQWSLIANDDLAGAFWIARSRGSAPVPDWLLKAVQASRWIREDSEDFIDDLFNIAIGAQPDSEREEEVMLGLAAALRTCLIAPRSGLIDWLKSPSVLPAIFEIVKAVKDFAQRGRKLIPLDLLEAAGAEKRRRSLMEAAKAVKRWLDEAPLRKLKIRRASVVWNHLVRNDLRNLLQPVVDDERGRLEEIRKGLKEWQDYAFIGKQIDRIDQELIGIGKGSIVADPRNMIVRGVEEVRHMADHWCDLVEQDREIAVRGDWLLEQTGKLRIKVQEALPGVEAELAYLMEVPSLAAASKCLRHSLAQLRATLNLPLAPGEEDSSYRDSWEWLPLKGQSLKVALNRRLIRLPTIPLNDNYQLAEEHLTLVAPALRDAWAQGNSPKWALEDYLERENYRFLESDLLPALSDNANYHELEQRYENSLEVSRDRLRAKIQATGDAIEQALIDGIISDVEHSSHDAAVSALDPEQVLNFPPNYEKLQEILDALQRARQDRLGRLRAEWETLQQNLSPSLIPLNSQERIREAVGLALTAGDTRVVEEYLSHLNQLLEGEGVLDINWFAPPSPRRSEISEFLKSARDIEENLSRNPLQLREVESALRDGRNWAGLKFSQVPKPRRDEAIAALEAWHSLKKGPLCQCG